MQVKKSILPIFLILLPCFLSGQIRIQGRIKIQERLPRLMTLAGAEIKSDIEKTYTDRKGRFSIQVNDIGDTIFIGRFGKYALANKQGKLIVWFKSILEIKEKRGGFCVLSGTKIKLKDGREKNIESVRPGDTVLTLRTDDFKIQQACVTKIDSVRHENLAEVMFEGQIRVKSTNDHPYFVSGKGWCSINPQQTFKNYNIPAKRYL